MGESNTSLSCYLPGNYFGLSNKKIGKLLNCKQTHGHRLRSSAEKAGFISSKQRYKTILILDHYDLNLKKEIAYYKNINPGRVKFAKFKNKIHILYQLHNEITVKIKFTNRKHICKE